MVMLDRDGTARTKTWLAKQGSSSDRTRALEMLAPELLPPKPKPEPKPNLKLEPKVEEKPIEPLDAASSKAKPNVEKSPLAVPTSRPY